MKAVTTISVLLLAASVSLPLQAQQTSANEQIAALQQQGAEKADPQRGKLLWYAKNGTRSCASCHGQSPLETGRHAKTRKPIKPMALSKNPQLFTSRKKTEKWFLRNCKWTLGRVCTVQEKVDIMSWLSSQ